MKKWLLIIASLILLIAGIIYFSISPAQNFVAATSLNCTDGAINRLMINQDEWHRWWPGEKKGNDLYVYKACNYKIDAIRLNGIEFTIFNTKDSVKGFLKFTYLDAGTTQLQLSSAFTFATNPLKRFMQFKQSGEIKENINLLLDDVKRYFDKEENIYGMKVVKQASKESSLVSTKKIFTHYPSVPEVYDLINSLKQYVVKKGGEENNPPMLHVHNEVPGIYETMVGLPLKADLPSEGEYQLKRMMQGSMLMAEIKGGNYTLMQAEKELGNYITDYKKTSPAIPFQSLVTNRLLETDTSKWITKLYYPVFH
jgi:hypothetical protein